MYGDEVERESDIRHNMHNRDDQSAESREVQAVRDQSESHEVQAALHQNMQQARDQSESPHVEVDIPPVTRTDYWTNFIETFKRTLKNSNLKQRKHASNETKKF